MLRSRIGTACLLYTSYEKAKQQELAETQTTAPVEEVAPVVSAPVEAKVVESAPVGTIREEKVTVVSGDVYKRQDLPHSIMEKV